VEQAPDCRETTAKEFSFSSHSPEQRVSTADGPHSLGSRKTTGRSSWVLPSTEPVAAFYITLTPSCKQEWHKVRHREEKNTKFPQLFVIHNTQCSSKTKINTSDSPHVTSCLARAVASYRAGGGAHRHPGQSDESSWNLNNHNLFVTQNPLNLVCLSLPHQTKFLSYSPSCTVDTLLLAYKVSGHQNLTVRTVLTTDN